MPKVKNTEERNIQRKRYYTKHRKHAFNKNKRWEEDEISLLFTFPYGDVSLSKQIGRSVAAIQVKRALTTWPTQNMSI